MSPKTPLTHSGATDPRLSSWNATRREYPTGLCLHELIEAQVERTPGRVAVSFEGEELTYRELDRRADRVAVRLRDLDVGPDAPVGVFMERSPELVVGLLAVLKAGGAYLPLDPEYPEDRRRFMAEDAQVKALLVDAAHAASAPMPATDQLETLAVGDVWLGSDGERDDRERDGQHEQRVGRAKPDHLAYVMYTSGSTGRPKGVMVEHRSIVNRLLWMQEQYSLGPADVAVQKTPFSFDVSVWEFFWPLMVGARLEVARPGGHKDNGYLARLVEEAGVTVIHFVPSMLELFLEVEEVGERCRSLSHVICSGEALPRDVVNRFYDRMPPGVTLWNLYGPTEAAVDVTYWRCDRDVTEGEVPIGRPVANTRIHVVDDEMRILPVGETGELVIAGIQVARGYLNRPELTRERFVTEPAVPGADPDIDPRAYRTGDLARWSEDGAVEFLGRADHQVKIRGQRVELGEVEAALRRQPRVVQAAAVVRRDREADPRLVGYVVLEDGSDTETASLRDGLAGELPQAMVPSAIVRLESMPLSPNGKLDRDALPEPTRSRPDLGVPYVEPRDDLEACLVDAWSEILGMDRIGIHDPFFELGASSLHAARFVNKIQEEIGEFVYVVTVFDTSNVAEYAAFLRQDYGDAVERRFGGSAAPSVPTGTGIGTGAGQAGTAPTAGEAASGKLEEDAVRRMQAAIPTFDVRERGSRGSTTGEDTPLNPPAVFILAPPRSGTTLLRVMLAGHPDLFAASELNLLQFETLGQRRRALSGRHEAWLDGVYRTLMELEGDEPDAAKARMAGLEEEDLAVAALYRRLQERLDGRMLIEKTPAYAADPNALERAERDFERPLYLHLSRHPYAMVDSFVSYHMEQILFLEDHDFTPRQLGELLWVVSHRNVSRFLEGIPDRRKHHLRFEDLVRDPEESMRRLCEGIGIPYDDALVKPYEGLERKMVDGVHRDSTPMGDTRLLERRKIDPAVADRWKGVLDDDFLGEPAWTTAEALGYERPAGSGSSGTARSARRAPDPDRPGSGEGRDGPKRRDEGGLGERGSKRRERLRERRSRTDFTVKMDSEPITGSSEEE